MNLISISSRVFFFLFVCLLVCFFVSSGVFMCISNPILHRLFYGMMLKYISSPVPLLEANGIMAKDKLITQVFLLMPSL